MLRNAALKPGFSVGHLWGDPEEALCKVLPAFGCFSQEGTEIRDLIPLNILSFSSCPQNRLPAKNLI